MNTFLVNNAPEGCQFRITRKKGSSDDNGMLVTPEQIGKDDSEKLVQITPSQGDLEAYSSSEIKTILMGKYDENDLQTFCNHIFGKSTSGVFEKEWTYTIRAHLSHDEQHLDLAMKGISMVPKLSLTPTYLEFGTTSLQQKQKKTLKIENFSSKAVIIEFDNSGNYSFTPQKIKLSSQGQTKIEVTFCPKKVGDLN